jgi:signal transduction histidine kinase
MSESQTQGPTERFSTGQSSVNKQGEKEGTQSTALHSESSMLTGPLHAREPSQPLQTFMPDLPKHQQTPRWLRPFFSLRIQLTVTYSLLSMLLMACSSILLIEPSSPLKITLTFITLALAGIGMAFLMTTVLLRPLWQVTDAAQAIASGDLEQRVRLPLRLPPQDEIDRLSGSIDAMVNRLEHVEEMQQASEERFHRFFSDASHQLRTPLTSIRGFTELLMRGAKDDPETAPRILSRMKNEAERMTNLINDLLTLSRLDDRHPLKLKYIDLVELAVEGIEQTRKRVNDERKISLVLATEERLGLQADRDRIKQLLFILLDNALKYGRANASGMITLKLDKHNGQAIIQVLDNGEGIAQEDMEHIFDAFYRGRHRSLPSSTVAIGTGLGLTIASAIARAHNGSITVYSNPGSGTEFKVTLPSA